MWAGKQLYQIRARDALPILVRQALAQRPLFYSEIAEELGISNPRSMNYILGSVGATLIELGKKWREQIPPIQCLVISRATGMPGEGVWWFLHPSETDRFARMSPGERRRRVEIELQRIHCYPRWPDVLRHLGLAPIAVDWSAQLNAAAALGAGESDDHRSLKEFVSRHPKLVGATGPRPGRVEHALPSGDRLDVSFETPGAWVAAEVKSGISNEADLIRGLFQCVKYVAVMRAVDSTKMIQREIRAVLVLEGRFPDRLVPLRNTLHVEVRDGVLEQANDG